MRPRGPRYQQNSLGLRLDLSLKFQKNLRGNKYKAIATSFFQDGFDMPCLMSFRGKKNTSLLSQVLLKMLQNPKVRTHHQQLIHNPIALSSLSLNTLFNKWVLSSIFTMITQRQLQFQFMEQKLEFFRYQQSMFTPQWNQTS